MMTLSSVGLVALIAATTCVSAGPLNLQAGDSTKCATRCPESSKFTYTSGKMYEYSYSADVKTSIPDTTEEHSSLHMTATVQIEVLSQCDMVLRLMDVSLQDSNPRDYGRRNHVEKAWDFKRALQEHSMRFGFLDGHVADVCPNPNEIPWVLNIKRAIISALQNTMHSLDANTRVRETDVAGDCEVEYQVLRQGYGVSKVKKIKDILGCVNGHGHESFFQGVPYKVPSKLQSLPILKTTHECEQAVNSQGLMVKASCMEKHIFRPFSKYHSGAQTEVTYKLEFVREQNGISSRETPVLQRTSLVYDFTPSAEEAARGRREAAQTMGELCSLTTEDIRPEVPGLFTKLVHQMRLLDAESLRAIHSSIGNMCDKADKFYHDAIPMLGTPASVSMIYDLIKSGKVTGSEADIWLTSLSFIPRPTKEMLPIAMSLMEDQSSNKKAALAVSALINNYCKRSSNCLSEPVVARIIGMFEKNLRYKCQSSNDAEHEHVMMSLKAIGNTGHAESAIPTLTRCFRNEEASMDTRIAAVQAMRHMPCKADDELFDLYRSDSNDAELRIHAYLMLMECPSESTINRIQSVLEREKISQVGSFVWTHLTNLAETSSPLKQTIQTVLAEQTLKQRFNMDKRKFSRNMEWSLFSELANTGASVESNVIWSEKSYIPRSAMVNLTADLFGHSVNFLEAGARVEGFERLLESVFGPSGSSNDVPSRSKRSVIKQSALDIIERRFKVKNEEKPSASYYMKIFGNEIRYEDLHGLDLASLKEKLNYLDWLIELAKEHDYDVTKSLMFLDSTMIFPTALGLPLKLHATGTATVNMKVKGKLDMRKMFKWPSTIDIAGQVKPSAAIEVSGDMGVDAFVTHTGLRMVSTLHTSTVTDGRLELKDGQVFNMDINFPKEKMEVFSAETKFYVLHRGEARSQRMITEGRTEKAKCIGGSLVKAFGFEVCGEIQLPAFKTDTAPWFPMTGPAAAKFYINKKDTLTGVHVEASYQKQKRKVGDQVEITDIARINFNTPGSRYDREFLIDFNLQRASKSMTLNVKSPWKKMEVEGSLVNTEELKRFIGKALVDQRNEYGITGEVQITKSKGVKEYTPKLEIIIPNKSPMTLGGKLMQKSGKLVVDVSMRNVLKGPVEIRGEVSKIANKKRQKFSADLDFESPDFKVKFDAFHDNNKQGNSISQRCELLWNGPKVKKERFVLSNKIRDQSTKNLMQYSVDSSVESSMWPDYNAQMSTEMTKTDKSITGKFEGASGYNHGKTMKLSFGANKNGNLKNAKVAGNLKLEIPTMDIDYEVNLDHKHSKREVSTNANMRYGGNKEASFIADMTNEASRQLKANAVVKLQYPGRSMSWEQKVEEKSPNEYHHELNVQLDQNNAVRMTSVYKMKPRHEVDAQLYLPNFRPMTLRAHGNPNLKNFDARGEVTYEDKTFALGSNWLYRDYTNAFNAKGGFDLSYPGRRITTQASLDRKGSQYTGQLTNKWDADSDERKMVSLSADIRAEKESPAWDVKAEWYPNKFVQLSGSAAYSTNGWFHPEKDWHGRALMTTSFPGLEKISGNFKLDQKDSNIQTHIDASWSAREKIDADITFQKREGWKSIVTSGTVTTPFRTFRQGRFNLQYDLDPRKLNVNSDLMWNNEKMTLVATGKVIPRRHLFEGTAKLTSPFSGYEVISVGAKHNDDGRVFKTELDATFGREKITGRFNMNHDRQGYFISNNGNLNMRSTFRGFRQTKLSWSHRNTADSWNCMYDLDSDKGKAGMRVDAEKKFNNRNHQLALKADMNTPWTEDIEVDMTHTGEAHKWDGKSNGIVKYGSKTIQLVNEVSVQPWEYLVHKFKLTTPFRSLRELSIDLDTKETNGAWNTHNEIKWGPNDKITVDGSVKVPSLTDLEAEGRITTPFTNFERMVLKTTLKEMGPLFESSLEAEYGRGKKLKIGGKLGIKRVKRVALDIESECPYIRKAAFNIQLTGKLRDFVSDIEISHNDMHSAIKGKLSLDTSNIHDIKGKMNLRTPFQNYEKFRGLISHKKQAETFKSDFSLDLPRYRTTFNNDMTITSWKDFKTTTQVQYKNNKRIVLETEFKTEPTILARVGWKSPFNKFEEVDITFNHEGDMKNFKSSGELSYSPRDKISANAEFNMARNNIQGSGRFSSPFTDAVSVKFNHDGGLKSFKSNAEITTPRDRLEASGEFDLSQNSMRGSGKLMTSRSKTVTFSFNHNGGLTEFQNEATVQVGRTRVSGESEFRVSGTTLSAKASASTPWQNWERLEMKVNHNGPWDNFQNSGEIRYGSKVITGSSSLNKNADDVNGRIALSLPCDVVREVSANFEHSGRWKNFRNSGTVSYNGHPYSASSDFKLTNRLLKANAKIEIPQTYSLSLLHKGKLSSFNNEVIVEYPAGRMAADSEFKLQGTSLETKAKLRTPFRGYEEFSAKLSHKGDWADFRCAAELQTPFENISPLSIEVSHNGDLRDFRSSARVEGPFRRISPLSVEVTHKGELTDMSSSTKLMFAGSEISASNTFKYEGGNVEGSAELSTPYSAVRKASLNYKHNGQSNNFQSDISGELNRHRMNMNVKHRGTLRDFTSELSGFLNRHRASASVKHNGDIRDFTTELAGEMDAHKLDLTFRHTGNLERFETSSTGSFNNRRGSMNLKHNGELTRFNTEGSAEINGRRAAFSVNHNGNSRRINTDLSGEYDGKAISGVITFTNDRSIEGTATIKTPFANYEQINAAFKHTGELSNFKSEASLSCRRHSVAGNIAFVQRRGVMEGSASVTLPFRKLRSLDAEFRHRGELRDFTSSGSLKYNGKKMEAEVTQKTNAYDGDIDHTSSATLKTPFDQIRNGEAKAEFHKKRNSYDVKAEVSHNDEKCLDIDGSYTHMKKLRVIMQEPHPIQTTVNVGKEGNSYSADSFIDWNSKNPESNIRMEGSLKNDIGNRKISLKAITPRKTYAVTTGYVNDGQKMMHDFEYDPTPGRKFNYGIEMSSSTRGRQSTYDGTFSMTSPIANLHTSFSHTARTGRMHSTTIHLGSRERLTLMHELRLNDPSFTSTLSIKHPRFTRDAVFSTEGTIDTKDKLIRGKTTWEFEDQSITFGGKLAQENSRDKKQLIAEMELRHPQSFLDVTYSGKLEKNREGYSTNAEFKYMTSQDRQHKVNSLRAGINKIREEMNIEVVTPLTSLSLSGRRLMGDYENGIHRYSVSGEKDGKAVRAELDVNARDLSMDLKTFSPNDNTFHMYAKYMNPSTIQMEAYHTESGRRVPDAVFSVRLNSSRLLHTRAHLRPTILEDIKELLRKSREHPFEWIETTRNAISQDLRYKKHYMKGLVKPVRAVSAELGNHLSSAWDEVARVSGDLYRQNRFYIRDTHYAVNNAITSTSRHLSKKGRELTKKLYGMIDEYTPMINEAKQKMGEKYTQAIDYAIGMTETTKRKLSENYEAAAKWCNEVTTTIRETLPELTKYGDMLSDKVKETVDEIRKHPRVMAVLDALIEFDMTAYFKPLKHWAKKSSDTTRKMAEQFREFMYRVKEIWSDISSNPKFQEVQSYVVKAVKSSKWLYEYLEIEENVIAIAQDLYKNGLVTLKQQAWEMADEYLKFDKTRFTVWMPKSGEIQAEVYLPIELRDLQTLPQVNLMQYWIRVRDFAKEYLPDENWVFWDTWYKYKPSLDYKDWIPPFKSHATISGNQHFMTFDKTFYEFAGDCSYLLTKDFIDGNFSVVVNYKPVKGKMIKKSITVIADDKQLQISPDFQIKLDSKRVELPLEFGKTGVLRVGNKIKVINANGFEVVCDLPHDRCTVGISGWYHNKVAGLMGTYDNEPATDMTTATNTLTTNTGEFAQSWSIGSRCKAVNSAVKVPTEGDSRYKRLCKKFFEDQSSPFRPCFRQVDPTPFMEMCMNDMPVNENRMPTDSDTCDIGAFYVDECKRAGVPLRLTPSCVRCKLPNNRPYYEGQNITLSEKEKTVPDSADVVFVVEHGPCNKDMVKKMRFMINSYERNMKKNKLKFVHYGLVSYGGSGFHYEPHSHTLDAELLNKRASFMLGLDGFKFQSRKSDVLAALHYAALYPFRTGVSKSIILMPCQACHGETIRYADIQQLLLDRDIRLHTFIQENFKLQSASKSPKSSYIIGVDYKEAYTTKDFKDKKQVQGDENLRKQVLVPKDTCNALAMETGGSVWSAPQLTEARKKIQKMFLDVHSRVISQKAEPSDCQICECVSDDVGVGMSVCRSCEPRNPFAQIIPDVINTSEVKKVKFGKPKRNLRNLKKKTARN